MGVWSESDRILLGRRGIPYTEEVSFALKSMHFMSAVTYLKNLYSLPDSEESIAEEITDIVRDKYFHEVKLMPFVPEMIAHFKASGIKMCAATSNSRELAEGVLGHNGILDELEFIITSDEAGSSKEDPKIFHMCAERLGTAPDETAVLRILPMRQRQLLKTAFTLLA